MSFRWLRGSSRTVAVILLLASMWQLPHRSQDDEICAPAAEVHDESRHVVTSPDELAHPDHCAVCHWVRWMKPVFTAGPAIVAHQGAGSDLAPVSPALRRDPASERRPARAPPAL